jgi:hypothetical protein
MLGLLAGLRRGHARNNRIVSSLNSLFPSLLPCYPSLLLYMLSQANNKNNKMNELNYNN